MPAPCALRQSQPPALQQDSRDTHIVKKAERTQTPMNSSAFLPSSPILRSPNFRKSGLATRKATTGPKIAIAMLASTGLPTVHPNAVTLPSPSSLITLSRTRAMISSIKAAPTRMVPILVEARSSGPDCERRT